MGIGTSLGAFYRDEGHYAASKWDGRYDDNDDSMVVNPEPNAKELGKSPSPLTEDRNNIDPKNMETLKNQAVDPNLIYDDKGNIVDYAIPKGGKTGPFDTPLSKEDKGFQDWKEKYAPNDSGADYDLQGAYLGGAVPAENGHFPDTWKKPNHPTFSDQSKYYKYSPDSAGSWDGDKFIPPTMLHPIADKGEPASPDSPFHPVSGFFNRLSIVNAFKGMMGGSEEAVKNLPENFTNSVKHVIDTLSTPGKVMQEGVSPQQEVEKAADLAMLMVGAPAPIAAKMADGTLGSFAGVGSKTVSTKDRFNAAIMEKKGASSEDIWKATGFFKGTDGRWRYEISDEGMKLSDKDWKFGEEGKLSDFVEHPKLFEAYPELKDITFKVAPKEYPYVGSFNTETKTLTINPSKVPSGDKGLLDVISHELQHVIQRKEGFAEGTNPTMAYDRASRALIGKMVADKYPISLMMLYKDIFLNAEKFGIYMYERTPGEVEANLVMNRRQLSDQMRKDFSPMETQRLLEGTTNALSGGQYREPFVYPSPYKSGPGPQAVAPTEFRRAANENFPEGHPDRPYNPREPGMIGSAEMDKFTDELSKHFYETVTKPHEKFIELYDKWHEYGQSLVKKENWTELNVARYNKMGKEIADHNRVPYEPIEFKE